MENDAIVQATTPIRSKKPAFGRTQAIIVIVFLLLITGGVVYYLNNSNKVPAQTDIVPTSAPVEQPTPEITEVATSSATPTSAPVTPTVKPSPTKKPEVKASTDMNIQILNGTGEVGAAAGVRDFLMGKGYKYFELGNADNNDYQGMSFKAKTSMDTYAATLRGDLAGKYKMSSDSATLSDDSIFDAVVILGKQ